MKDVSSQYRKLGSDGNVDSASRFHNENNYLVVPANFNLAQSNTEASKTNTAIAVGELKSRLVGLLAGKEVMKRDFREGGRQDLQRQDVPGGETDAIAKDAASWYFGYVMQLTKMPDILAEVGAGYYNFRSDKKRFFNRLLGLDRGHHISISHFGMDAADANSFDAGIRAAKADEFHNSVIHSLPREPYPFAPRWRGQKEKRPLSGRQQHTAGNDFHSAVTAFMDDKLAKGNMFFALAPKKKTGPEPSKRALAAPGDLMGRTNQEPHMNLVPDARFRSMFDGLPTGVTGDEMHSLFRVGADRFGGGRDVFGDGKKALIEASIGFDHAREQALPSFAPVRREAGGSESVGGSRFVGGVDEDAATNKTHLARRHIAAGRAKRPATLLDGQGYADPDSNNVQVILDEVKLSRAVSDLLDRQARLPPAGMTGFDPRLSNCFCGKDQIDVGHRDGRRWAKDHTAADWGVGDVAVVQGFRAGVGGERGLCGACRGGGVGGDDR